MSGTVMEDVQEKNKRLEQENALILLQLHQVQEELEHYFQVNQGNERKLEKINDDLVLLGPVSRSKLNPLFKFTDLVGITIQGKIDRVRGSGFFDEVNRPGN